MFHAAAAQGEEALFRGAVQAAANYLVDHGMLRGFPVGFLLCHSSFSDLQILTQIPRTYQEEGDITYTLRHQVVSKVL